jgi:hypothetical protein
LHTDRRMMLKESVNWRSRNHEPQKALDLLMSTGSVLQKCLARRGYLYQQHNNNNNQQ